MTTPNVSYIEGILRDLSGEGTQTPWQRGRSSVSTVGAAEPSDTGVVA